MVDESVRYSVETWPSKLLTAVVQVIDSASHTGHSKEMLNNNNTKHNTVQAWKKNPKYSEYCSPLKKENQLSMS